jgi:hypothetical protein
MSVLARLIKAATIPSRGLRQINAAACVREVNAQ